MVYRCENSLSTHAFRKILDGLKCYSFFSRIFALKGKLGVESCFNKIFISSGFIFFLKNKIPTCTPASFARAAWRASRQKWTTARPRSPSFEVSSLKNQSYSFFKGYRSHDIFLLLLLDKNSQRMQNLSLVDYFKRKKDFNGSIFYLFSFTKTTKLIFKKWNPHFSFLCSRVSFSAVPSVVCAFRIRNVGENWRRCVVAGFWISARRIDVVIHRNTSRLSIWKSETSKN